ncbi:MAG: VacB/RNase II family 3'-5' exoribonuclease [Candidatus Sumerlaeota bacterium]|nr:VacB/RNase II family 3'-5' exoribonuclease [Candidatus Sumerlaeota bacterium]
MPDLLKNRIRAWLAERGGRTASLGQLLNALGLAAPERKLLRRVLRELEAEGVLASLKGRRYTTAGMTNHVIGVIRISSKGFGFVIPEEDCIQGDEQCPIFVPRKRMADAMHGDRVVVRLLFQTAKNPEGEIAEVLERGTRDIVGVFYHTRFGGQVIPRDDRFTRSITTPRPDAALNLSNGDYVAAEIMEWTPAELPLKGRVIQALGDPSTPGIDITMIIRDAGAEQVFPPEAVAEADMVADEIPVSELARRVDYRGTMTFTMDGASAMDFDDALSISFEADDMWRLGVHIADVAHYVSEGGSLDQEAFRRGTSIYPVDRVVPMLPERLSNGVCSLKPGGDRLALSCIMTIDGRGGVRDYSIRESVIRSSYRLIYEDVQALMEGVASPAIIRAAGSVRPQLELLYGLRRALTSMRMKRGALDLDMSETEVVLDEQGVARGLVRRPRLESHRVVEECMLIANEVVASHLFNLRIPGIFRVHKEPDIDRLRRLQPVIAHLGARFPAKHDITAAALQAVLDSTTRLDNGFIVRRLILQSLTRAHYADENLGHYGLGSSCYTHFTSPIRRYPDLLVHRLLKEAMREGMAADGLYTPPAKAVREPVSGKRPVPSEDAALPLSAKRMEWLRAHLGEWARHCSECERRAEEIERQATDVKAMEYMRAFVGEEYDGFVTGVRNFGFFVELVDVPVTGLVHVRTLDDDFYEYDEERMMLTGKHVGAAVKLGDRVNVMIANVNVASREMNLRLVQKPGSSGYPVKHAQLHDQRTIKKQRHEKRRPHQGGFQARGGRRKR